ncbi:MAG: DUF5343 domain-containing protein [Candidatus Limnocylindria bacterium]
MIPVFRALGFIDASQGPTAKWTAYRDKGRAGQVLGEALRAAYSDLFSTYPDAQFTRSGHDPQLPQRQIPCCGLNPEAGRPYLQDVGCRSV